MWNLIVVLRECNPRRNEYDKVDLKFVYILILLARTRKLYVVINLYCQILFFIIIAGRKRDKNEAFTIGQVY